MPEAAAVPVLDAPAEMSSGLLVDTPENSIWVVAVTAAEAVRAITEVVGFALEAYHSSPSE
jgi:hypothetical protein